MKNYDTIIIGAGVIGCAIAYELSKKGYKSLNIEKLADAGEGSTAASCAIIRTHYSTHEGVSMAYEGLHFWRNWEKYLGGIPDEKGYSKFQDRGAILIKSEGFDWQKIKKHFDAIGVKYEEWTNEQVIEKASLYDMHSFWPVRRPEDPGFFNAPEKMLKGAIFESESGYINDPGLSTHNIMRAAQAHGARFLFNSKVVDIRTNQDRINGITLADGQLIDAPVVVNASGPHSYKINAMVPGVVQGCRIKTRALRHEVMYCPSPDGYDYLNKGYFTSDGDIGAYFRPEIGNMFLIGSEDPDCDTQQWVDPDEFYAGKGDYGRDKTLTNEQWKAQCYRLGKRIPSLRVPNKPNGVVDLYDVADDWLPIYDKSDCPGFYMAIGTSGNQYKNAPVVGRMMAGLIGACEKGLDHDKTPFQHKYTYIDGSLDMGFFSRKRQINYDSSFSVTG